MHAKDGRTAPSCMWPQHCSARGERLSRKPQWLSDVHHDTVRVKHTDLIFASAPPPARGDAPLAGPRQIHGGKSTGTRQRKGQKHGHPPKGQNAKTANKT